MFIFNYLFENLFSVYKFVNSVLIPFLSNHIFEGIIIISIIFLASSSKAGKILDTTAKFVGIAASSTVLHTKFFKSSSSNGDEDNKKEDDKKTNNDKNTEDDKKQKIIKVPMKNNNIKHSFLFTWILTNLDINVNSSDSDITQLAYGVFLLSLVAILCFINILGYFSAYYLIQKSNYEIKYPKLAGFINYYKKTNLIFLIIDVLLCLFCLSFLVIFSLLLIFK